MAELEHNVIRHGMSRPKLPLVSWVLPKSFDVEDERRQWEIRDRDGSNDVRGATKLKRRGDFRRTLALNCSSLSCPKNVVVYDSVDETKVEELLDKSCRLMMTREFVMVDRVKLVVYLPKVCDWYREDFVFGEQQEGVGGDYIVGGSGSGDGGELLLRMLMPFMMEEDRNFLRHVMMEENKVVKVKYTSYNFGFRDRLVQADDEG